VGAGGHPLPDAKKCRIFPANNPWNQRVDELPAARNSDAIIGAIGPGDTMHADFGSGRYDGGPIGIPYTTVGRGQKRVHVSFDYADESDRGRYPIPRRAPIEGGRNADGDRHVLVVDRSRCKLYELFDAHPQNGGASWHAGSGAVWKLRSNHLRHKGFTSADAAGLPILPGLARRDEADSGAINHALRITVPTTQKAYIHPATHWASSNTDVNQPPMGLRVRLKASYDISRLSGQARAVAQALKTYGALVADNAGSPRVYISGATDRGWNDEVLNGIKSIPASALEAVVTNPVVRG
jgi:hypothetical protein